MGLLAFLRGQSSKDIRLKQDISQYLVFPYSLKGGKVWLGKKAVVPDNTILAFCSSGKVLDILPTGEHTLGAVVLPNCSSKFKLYKLDKYGKPLNKFKCYVYYIDLLPKTNFQFSTYKKIKYENAIDKKFRVHLDFELDFDISDPKQLLKKLFGAYAYLKNGEAEDILNNWLSEFTTNELEKQTYRRIDFESRLPEVKELLGAKIDKQLKNIGLKKNDFRITEMILSKNKNKKTNPLENEENIPEFATEEMLNQQEAFAEQQYEKNENLNALSQERPLNYAEIENISKIGNEILESNAQNESEHIELKNRVLAEKNVAVSSKKYEQEIVQDNLEKDAIKVFEEALKEEDSLNFGWRGLESLQEDKNKAQKHLENNNEKI